MLFSALNPGCMELWGSERDSLKNSIMHVVPESMFAEEITFV